MPKRHDRLKDKPARRGNARRPEAPRKPCPDPFRLSGGPFSPPDWRWRRAVWLAEHGPRRCPAREGALVVAAVRYLRDLGRGRGKAARADLAVRLPALAGAVDLDLAPEPWPRWVLEARLLTGEPCATTAAKCGLAPDTVDAYHDLFYCVRPRLEARGYILHTAIGPRAHGPLGKDDRDVLLKLYGFFAGPHVLDALLDYFTHPPDPGVDPGTLSGRAHDEWASRMAMRLNVLIHTIPVNERTAWAILRLHQKFLGVDGRRPPQTPFEFNIDLSWWGL